MLPSLGMQVPVSLTSKASPTDKANYPHPHGLAVNEAWHQHVTEVHAKAGDVVIFPEALVWRISIFQLKNFFLVLSC